MDAIEMLTKDHEKVRELFRRYNGGGGLTGLIKRTAGLVEARVQRDILARICQELAMHTKIEEAVFYPAVRALGDAQLDGLVREAIVEHAGVKAEVGELRERTGEAEKLATKVGQLEQDVEHHASEEEREMFPRLKELMPAAERVALAKQMGTLKRTGGPAPSVAGGRARRVAAARKTRPTAKKPGSHAAAASRSRKRTTPRASAAAPSKTAASRSRDKRKAARKKR